MRLNTRMPELDGATAWLNGGVSKREDLMGKLTLFHFWSVSCDMCKTALPSINELYDIHRVKLQVIAVHIPRSEDDLSMSVVEDAVADYHLIHPIFIDNDHMLTDLFSVKEIPAYFLFDQSGRLRYYQSGKSSTGTLSRRIERLI